MTFFALGQFLLRLAAAVGAIDRTVVLRAESLAQSLGAMLAQGGQHDRGDDQHHDNCDDDPDPSFHVLSLLFPGAVCAVCYD